MVAAGINPARALRAATATAAELLGRADIGILEPGRVADIVALPGDPIAEARTPRRSTNSSATRAPRTLSPRSRRQLRVSSKKRDDPQAVIAMLKKADLDVALQFVTYR